MGWLWTDTGDDLYLHKNALRVILGCLLTLAIILTCLLAVTIADINQLKDSSYIEVVNNSTTGGPAIAIQLNRNYVWEAVLDKTIYYLHDLDITVYRTAAYNQDRIVYYLLVDDCSNYLRQYQSDLDCAGDYLHIIWQKAGYELDVVFDVSDSIEPECTLYQNTNGIPSFWNSEVN